MGPWRGARLIKRRGRAGKQAGPVPVPGFTDRPGLGPPAGEATSLGEALQLFGLRVRGVQVLVLVELVVDDE